MAASVREGRALGAKKCLDVDCADMEPGLAADRGFDSNSEDFLDLAEQLGT